MIDFLIGENVKAIREKKKLSQSEFAKVLTIDQVRLSYIENNKRKLTLPILLNFSKYLKKDLDSTLRLLTSKRGKKK